MIDEPERAGVSPGACAGDGFALWAGFSQSHAVLTRALDADLRAAHGVSLSDYEILFGLGAISCERMRMTALADRVDLSPSGLSRAIERLEARGLVRREPCPEDRRGAFATLTDAGMGLVRVASATYGAGIQRRFLDRLTPGERAAMASAWSRLQASQHACCGGGCNRSGRIGPFAGMPVVFGMRGARSMSDAEQQDVAPDPSNFNQQIIEEFRANGGKVGGMFEGAPMLLLTTIGAKSGQPRVAPLVYTTDGERMVIIASKGGAPSNPDWFHNLRANPDVTLEVGTETFPARASIPADPERQRLFDQQAAQMPGFAEYQRNTSRQIPVVVLERAG